MTDKEKELPVTSENNVQSNTASTKKVIESVETILNHEMEPVKEKSDVSEQPRKVSGDFQVKNLVNAVKEKATEAFHFVKGGEGDNKGLVGTVKEKATGAFNYVAEKVTVATHAVTGDSSKEKIEKSVTSTETEQKKA